MKGRVLCKNPLRVGDQIYSGIEIDEMVVGTGAEKSEQKGSTVGVWGFYTVVALALVAGLFISACQWRGASGEVSASALFAVPQKIGERQRSPEACVERTDASAHFVVRRAALGGDDHPIVRRRTAVDRNVVEHSRDRSDVVGHAVVFVEIERSRSSKDIVRAGRGRYPPGTNG